LRRRSQLVASDLDDANAATPGQKRFVAVSQNLIAAVQRAG
jgi:hypothetical protein